MVVAGITAALLSFVLAAAIDWMWDLAVVGAVGIVCLGLLVGPATIYASDTPDARRLRLWPRIGVGAAVVALAFAQAIPLIAEVKVRDSQDALTDGDEEAALAAAEDAREVQGWAASPRLQLALVHEARGDLEEAREEIARAIDRDGSDWRLWAVAARIEEASGDPAAARQSLDQARALNPRSSLLGG
jgi:tetratricopeptide (TPR) repeat protein